MNKVYVLYNPLAGNNDSEERAKKLSPLYIGRELKFLDIRDISNYQVFMDGLEKRDEILICGGDAAGEE